MFRINLGAFALIAALAAPLAVSAQTAPIPPAGAPAAPVAPGATTTGPHNGHHRHHRRGFAHALRGLNLSDAQKTQISGIMKSARTNMQAGKAADPQTRRANMLALRQQIDGVLTPDQRTQLKANLSKERQNMKRDHGPAPAASPQ